MALFWPKTDNTVQYSLFTLTQCETWACLDAHKTVILGGIEGAKYSYVPFKTHTLPCLQINVGSCIDPIQDGHTSANAEYSNNEDTRNTEDRKDALVRGAQDFSQTPQ